MNYSIEVNAISEGINIDTLRRRSNSSSPNLLQELLTHSDPSFILYVDRMKAQNNNLL